jgi:hypothetical protein
MVRVTCDPRKRARILAERGLDMRRAGEVFAGRHLTRGMTASITERRDT